MSAVSMKQLCPSKRSRVVGSSAGDTDSSAQVLCISRGQREEGKAGEGYEVCGKRSRRKTASFPLLVASPPGWRWWNPDFSTWMRKIAWTSRCPFGNSLPSLPFAILAP